MTDKETIIASQEAEILRLQHGFDELRNALKEWSIPENSSDWEVGYSFCAKIILRQIRHITGA